MRKKDSYSLLKVYIEDYVKYMEKINDKRLKAAERECEFVRQEAIAFNILRQNMREVEDAIPKNSYTYHV